MISSPIVGANVDHVVTLVDIEVSNENVVVRLLATLGDQLVERGTAYGEDGVEDQAPVFSDLVAMSVRKFLNQSVRAR